MAAKRRTTRPSARAPPPIPPGFRTITPYLCVDGGAKALEFYVRAFGAKELAREALPDGKLVHGRIRIGDSIVMLSDAFPGGPTAAPSALGQSTVVLHLYSKDVRALWQKATKAGAKVVMPLADQFWGERYGQLQDPFGHVWSLSQQVAMSAAEKDRLQKEAMAMFASREAPG
jgi:PhnB protein